ncbi:ABC transporter permease [Bifidobacterium saguinibicoloris]|uniref:ABC transporter permease n=1 Tax=Bifidobacterium saguinibicoloris TaxID=2834433 RepID=UPI001C591CDB|nr:ABC transporter permease [Bifidobacterium saguinibicoloris]MBW3080034.1 ABC transporter permease [Bifidobacterium saguinibicoloris]
MNTCKATLRILAAHKLYIIIYLVLIGVMMLAVGGSALGAVGGGSDATYTPERAKVAVIDRDGNRGHIASAMRSALSEGNDLVDVADDPETLQQAVVSNWVDLIVIIPDGYADRMIASVTTDGATDGTDDTAGTDTKAATAAPTVDTVTSYTSGAGSMASMNVTGFLSMTRTTLIGTHVTAHIPGTNDAAGNADANAGATTTDSLPEGTVTGLTLHDLAAAATRASDLARDRRTNPGIRIDHTGESAASSEAKSRAALADGFGGMMKTLLYPLFLAMTVCTALVMGVFGTGEVRRRLIASPQRSSAMGVQRMATLCAFALVVVAAYFVVAFALMLAMGIDPLALPPAGVAMTAVSTAVYAMMTVACGFMLGETGCGDTMANGFANVFGLLLLFTSGATFPLDMIPAPMLTIGRMLPSWWYCTSIDDAFGIGTAATGGVDVAGWAASLGLVALFALAFACVGLAVGRIRRSRPASAASPVTRLAEA